MEDSLKTSPHRVTVMLLIGAEYGLWINLLQLGSMTRYYVPPLAIPQLSDCWFGSCLDIHGVTITISGGGGCTHAVSHHNRAYQSHQLILLHSEHILINITYAGQKRLTQKRKMINLIEK